MRVFLSWFADIFDLNVMVLFFIAAFFLLYYDARTFKKENFEREYKLASFFGYFYIIAGVVLYTVARLIRV